MASFYKTFQALRIVLSLAITAIFLSVVCAIPQSYADSVYTISNVKVDVSAENAIKAREQAFEQAQAKAFDELAKNLLDESELATFKAPSLSTISLMIQDYEVSNEKLSSKRYSGTYKIRFQERGVKKYFNKGASDATMANSSSSAKPSRGYSDIAKSNPVLVLPFIETNVGPMIWTPQNVWFTAWNNAPNLNTGLASIIVPLADIGDVQDISDNEALTYNPLNLKSMLQRYRASEAVIAIAKPEQGALNIELYRTDRGRPEFANQIRERLTTGQSEADLYAKAVQSVKAAINSDWKNRTAAKSNERGIIKVRATFSSLQQWSQIQRNLKRTNGVTSTELKVLSPREAYLDIIFNGNLEALKIALNQNALTLGEASYNYNNTASGNLNADYSQGMLGDINGKGNQVSPVYDLYLSNAQHTQNNTYYTNVTQNAGQPIIQPQTSAPRRAPQGQYYPAPTTRRQLQPQAQDEQYQMQF